jgi:hypothetical protein
VNDDVTPNPFSTYGHQHIAAATRAQLRAAETRERKLKVKVVQSEADAPMKLGPMEQAMADSSAQGRRYARHRRRELKAALQGPDGERWRGLFTVLRALTIEDPGILVEYLHQQHWLMFDADLHTRQFALSLIDDAIVRLRIQNGYPPIDDSIFDEPPTIFEIIRKDLRVMMP